MLPSSANTARAAVTSNSTGVLDSKSSSTKVKASRQSFSIRTCKRNQTDASVCTEQNSNHQEPILMFNFHALASKAVKKSY